jgi:hypothetical protein
LREQLQRRVRCAETPEVSGTREPDPFGNNLEIRHRLHEVKLRLHHFPVTPFADAVRQIAALTADPGFAPRTNDLHVWLYLAWRRHQQAPQSPRTGHSLRRRRYRGKRKFAAASREFFPSDQIAVAAGRQVVKSRM